MDTDNTNSRAEPDFTSDKVRITLVRKYQDPKTNLYQGTDGWRPSQVVLMSPDVARRVGKEMIDAADKIDDVVFGS